MWCIVSGWKTSKTAYTRTKQHFNHYRDAATARLPAVPRPGPGNQEKERTVSHGCGSTHGMCMIGWWVMEGVSMTMRYGSLLGLASVYRD